MRCEMVRDMQQFVVLRLRCSYKFSWPFVLSAFFEERSFYIYIQLRAWRHIRRTTRCPFVRAFLYRAPSRIQLCVMCECVGTCRRAHSRPESTLHRLSSDVTRHSHIAKGIHYTMDFRSTSLICNDWEPPKRAVYINRNISLQRA